jgi:hypothetical protein
MKPFWLVAGVTALSGCLLLGDRKVAGELEWLSGSGDPAVEFARRVQVVGPLAFGQTVAVAYHDPPRYRAMTIAAQPGDTVDVWVRSTDGNATAWLLDAAYKPIARNDDAAPGTLDSHVTATVPPEGPASWYIAFRESLARDASFSVSLAPRAQSDLYSCAIDADCTAVPAAGCCPNGRQAAVNVNQVAAYQQANVCPRPTMCPEIRFIDKRVPICDFASHSCQMIDPTEIHCGGFIRLRHECPQGFQCHLSGVPDVGGTCVRECNESALGCPAYQHPDPERCACVDNPSCGGIAAIRCTEPAWPRCADDPRDNCDPVRGGADCPGICESGCLQRMMCMAGTQFDPERCTCRPVTIVPSRIPPGVPPRTVIVPSRVPNGDTPGPLPQRVPADTTVVPERVPAETTVVPAIKR